MAYVITEPCVGVCAAECVEVCPCDCIHGVEDPAQRKQLFIDPDPCIDCAACEAVCPVNAIFHEDDVPEKWKHYVALNAAFFQNR